MIIDAHSHIKQDIAGYEASSSPVCGVQGEGLKDYLASYAKNGVDACFVFMLEPFALESRIPDYNDGLARVREMYPGKLFPWGTVNPSWPERKLRSEIRRIVKDLGLYGLKFIPTIQGFSLSGSGMAIVAEEAIDLGIPITTHDGSVEFCSAIQVAFYARKYPKLKVLSAHSGLRELWPDFIKSVKELPNLWLCLSGPTQWGIQKLYDELGPDRLLFGSDGGLGHPAVITAYIRRIKALNAPEEHKKMIFGTNALNFLNLDSDMVKVKL